ncbi:hypothetical protein Hypma_004492 [Hypsizygus marmoreus]|uniref:Uncharacterized protein n=1 Tax=Hypsizygus marmoreus TaxID=39966 RepID=A0A369K0V9_HYPMA|nr:hypothetical protein Hypma_004492 [Hypsizygus marmoreus]
MGIWPVSGFDDFLENDGGTGIGSTRELMEVGERASRRFASEFFTRRGPTAPMPTTGRHPYGYERHESSGTKDWTSTSGCGPWSLKGSGNEQDCERGNKLCEEDSGLRSLRCVNSARAQIGPPDEVIEKTEAIRLNAIRQL